MIKQPTVFVVLLSLIGCQGCGSSGTDLQVTKKPRPVAAQVLLRKPPPSASLVTAAVASWKTEEIGFEVSGRVEWVAEPNTQIEGRVIDAEGHLIVEGTPVAAIESERYQLQVDSAKAELARAEQNVEVALIDLEKSLQAQLRVAEVEQKLALADLDRSQRLNRQNAGSQADVDRDEANYQTAVAKVEQIEASRKAKAAEIEALRFQVKHAEQSLRDAERNLENCTLYSSFRGQIADVAVVPGSVVSSGQAVATVQMMDPIKVEVEVSAADSRRLVKRQRIPLRVTQSDGSVSAQDGFLYLIDPVADPQTRTFTLTLLMMNRKTHVESEADRDTSIAVTDQAWRVAFSFLPGAEEGAMFAVEDAIHRDEKGRFVWKIDNVHVNESLPSDRIAKVSKLRVRLGNTKLPFLGNWLFQQIIPVGNGFDPERDLIAGKLTGIEGEADEWEGEKILIDRSSQWMVRPGDLVQVDLSNGDAQPGFYVPMDAISNQAGISYLFVIDDESDEPRVKRIQINVIANQDSTATSSLRRIEAADKDTSLEGKQYVVRGSHYLNDNEPVKVVISPTADQAGVAQ